jgi:hypothetical protein
VSNEPKSFAKRDFLRQVERDAQAAWAGELLRNHIQMSKGESNSIHTAKKTQKKTFFCFFSLWNLHRGESL